MHDLEKQARAEARSAAFDEFEQALFDTLTGHKLPNIPIEKVNKGVENFIKLSDALRKALGEEWPTR